MFHYTFSNRAEYSDSESILLWATFSVPQAPTIMPSDSNMRVAVKGFSTQLRARILQTWMTKPTTDDENAYCRTRGRSVRLLAHPRSTSTEEHQDALLTMPLYGERLHCL